MLHTKNKQRKKTSSGARRRFLLPAVFLLLSFLLMILPLEGFVSSVKAVLSYIFIPQIRLAHGTAKYAENVHQTVQELLNTHRENGELKQQLEMNRLEAQQSASVFAENERLTQMMNLKSNKRWNGVWAKVAYREPSQWNSVIIDKGSADGIKERSAVISVEAGKEGLAGVVVEVTEKTSKVLLVRDEDFSAAVFLEGGKEEGLLTGNGLRPVRIKYIPLLTKVQPGDKVYTAATSSIFPAGILVGEVSAVRGEDDFQTALAVEVIPQVRSSAVKEVFVILEGGEK
ncbi:MAG: rod shape-determining protein MreC [Elusimicrobium sp.]|uniref:Cell shape-determining protein MreC n=1 Tax=Candidatus Avelusimicrobium gallicola TaxID=2562704 RepID=A0A928DNY4_9BACT|nr:rod shape-determining protein MreC [Elusimicrobium sp.]